MREAVMLNCAGQSIHFKNPHIMGVLNITPDSFYAASRCATAQQALQRAQQMVAEGATIIDVGAEATNPQLNPTTDASIELQRIVPVVELLARELSVPISVDTSKAEVIQAVVKVGAGLINDVRALREEGALQAAAATGLPVCLMHMHFSHGYGTADPNTVEYPEGVVAAIKTFLQKRINACLAAGIHADQIIIDPGIGGGNFGKSYRQNLTLLNQLTEFKTLNCPILVGVSRKIFIGELLNVAPEQRLAGSLAATAIAIAHGANIIRTHDVKATVDAVRIAHAIINEE